MCEVSPLCVSVRSSVISCSSFSPPVSSLLTANSRKHKAATTDVLWRSRALSRRFKHPSEKVCCFRWNHSHHSVFTLIFVLFSLIWLLMCLCNDVVYYTSVRPSVRTAGTVNLRFIPFPLLKDFVSPEQTECKDLTEIFNLGKVFRPSWKELVWYE